jgi:hypothetical protein
MRSREEEKEEEVPRKWSVKPVMLPDNPLALKRAWKANQLRLETAGIFEFLCWVQLVPRVAFVDHTMQFLETYSMSTGTAKVDGLVVDFSVPAIGRHLRLPADGANEGQLPALTRKQHEAIFEGEFPKETRLWRIDKAKSHWKLWLKFVNHYFLFRPDPETMAQKYVVAAVQAWEGRRINWSQIIHQKMHAEVMRLKVGVPRTLELYSAFYISFFCRDVPSIRLREAAPPSTSRVFSPPPSSPEDSEELMEDNQRLRVHLQQCRDELKEKTEQLWTKSELLITCQAENVKHLQAMAEAMREKMEYQRRLEDNNKTIASNQEQMAAQEREIIALQSRLDQQGGESEQLDDCQDQLRRATEEKEQLTERLKLMEEELAQQKTLLSDLNARGQPSVTPVVTNPIRVTSAPKELCLDVWSWESRGPVPKEFFELYERQCQLFLLFVGLKKSEWIDHSRFKELWRQSLDLGVENLFVEILARKHINLSDPYSAFMMIGDVGARVLLYYASLEQQWVQRCQSAAIGERREVSWQEYGAQVTSQFYSQPLESLQQWRGILQGLFAQVRQPAFLTQVMSANVQRLSMSPSAGFTGSHYLFQIEKTTTRLERYLMEVNTHKKPLINLHSQVQFDLPPSNFLPVVPQLEVPIVGSPLTLRYLGQYAHMFDNPGEEPIPTWMAIAWLLEDYGLSRNEEVPADIQYRRISRRWPDGPPASVASHPHFCPCPRRGKWNPEAILSSVEYNWPLIQGPKSTPAECRATYKQFFQEHMHHRDPVCFRAAVFANVLADWCNQWNVTIDVNRFHESHPEFLLLLKLMYRPTRWIRLVEVMAMTHFIAGAHKCLINEFPYTRAGPFERFLRWQRINAPEVVARDEDLQRAIEKMEARELKRGAEEAAQRHQPPPKLLRR